MRRETIIIITMMQYTYFETKKRKEKKVMIVQDFCKFFTRAVSFKQYGL